MQSLRTERLELVPATLALIEADLESPKRLGELLGAAVPLSWPPGEYDRAAMEFFRAELARSRDAVGWFGWYALYHPGVGAGPSVVGAGGYLGPPDADGVAEVGFSIAPEFRARGFATEMVRALVARALSLPEILRVVAHTTPANLGSITALERCGFVAVGAGGEPGMVRFERSR